MKIYGKRDRSRVDSSIPRLLGQIDYMHQTKLTLLVLTTILATSLPTYAQQSGTTDQPVTNQLVAQLQSQSTTTDLIGAGATLLNNLFNPPSRSAEIAADAEVKKAKIAAEAEIAKEKLRIEASKTADKASPVLAQWGVTRVNCAPGLVFINGISNDTVCIQPSAAMKAGYYTYDSSKQQLVRNNTDNSTNNNTNISANSNNDRQTLRTIQSNKVSNAEQGF